MHIIRDGRRTLKFEGDKLSSSTSRSPHSTRWVEFELYRTTNGSYVLARIGVSLYYHSGSCEVVSRNRIEPVTVEDMPASLVACPQCSPVPSNEEVLFPETARYWAAVCEEPQGVVESLYKYDDTHTRYLTHVSQRLLEDAARIDEDIADAFYNEELA